MEELRVWWIGERQPGDRVLPHVARHLSRAFDLRTAIWDAAGHPDDGFDPRRKQWHSTRLLSWLTRAGPPGKVLGVTDVDLFIPILTFVFGEAQLAGRAAVVSGARLRDPALRDERVMLERLAKECVHEVGHLFGLLHCATPRCVMGRSASMKDVDDKRAEPCPACKGRLRAARETR